MNKKHINNLQGMQALEKYKQGDRTLQTIILAVRYTLQEISKLYPGKSVEIRIPPAGATQILEGTVHRRGTPPAVIECKPIDWIDLCLGTKKWEDLNNEQILQAYGERSDLSKIFPIF